eukprot:1153223-Pelagomonas_calceolata.AAC.8
MAYLHPSNHVHPHTCVLQPKEAAFMLLSKALLHPMAYLHSSFQTHPHTPVLQPKEAAFTLVLLHPDPAARPTVAELLEGDMFRNAAEALRARHSMMEAEEAALETQNAAEALKAWNYMMEVKEAVLETQARTRARVCVCVRERERERFSPWPGLVIMAGCSSSDAFQADESDGAQAGHSWALEPRCSASCSTRCSPLQDPILDHYDPATLPTFQQSGTAMNYCWAFRLQHA